MSSFLKPSLDNRFSMADSEWSNDDIDVMCHYVKDPIGHASSSPHPLYDLPPEVSKGVQLASVEEKEEEPFVHINPTKQSANMKDLVTKTSQKNFPEIKENSNVKCWVKVYMALLTIAVAALAGIVIFEMLRSQNGSLKSFQKSSGEQNVSTALLEQLEKRVENLEKTITRLFRTYPVEGPQEVHQENGCLPDDVKIGSVCYNTRKVETLTQYEAVYKCSVLRHGQLAMIKSLEIQNQLFLHLQTDLSWWIDGYREDETKGFKFSDHTELTPNLTRNLTSNSGDCLSATAVTDELQFSIKHCHDYQDGFICQYPATDF